MLQNNLVPVVWRRGVGKPGQLIASIAHHQMYGSPSAAIGIVLLADLLVHRAGSFLQYPEQQSAYASALCCPAVHMLS